MTETSRFWDGTAEGDATTAPYDAADEFARVMESLCGAGSTTNRGGVFAGELNGLVVSGASTPISIATGSALVHGTWYNNSAVVSKAVSVPGGTRTDIVVLQKSWTPTQTVRIAVKEGTTALTQTAGTTWEIPLATMSNTGGTITVTDAREFIGRPGELKIATTTLAASAATITFSAIPNTFKHLRLVLTGAIAEEGSPAVASSVGVQFNGDAGNNYQYNLVQSAPAVGSGVPTSSADSSVAHGRLGIIPGTSASSTSFQGGVEATIFNYASASFYKTAVGISSCPCENTDNGNLVAQNTTSWLSTAAIKQITLTCPSGSADGKFQIGTVATLYGII